MKKLILFVFFSALIAVQAQDGKIRGAVYDELIGEPITNATISVQGSNQSTDTDLDGAFNLNLASGTYTIEINATGYLPISISDVTVLNNEVNVLDDIFLEEDIYNDANANNNQVDLDAVVISAVTDRDDEEALQRYKKKSAVIVDGISAARLKLTGDANAVQAAKRVTGLSVEDGKYLYVRGLGDRYAKTTLNGAEIPGLDPDRNTLQMDIFPSDLLSNLIVNKSFSAELPADFTGGLVNLETIDFPRKKFLKVSAGFGFNPQANLTDDYISYQGGQTDFLGFDDGTRELPLYARAVAESRGFLNVPQPNVANDQSVFDFASAFNPNLAARNQTSLLNSSFGISYGDQINLDNGNDIGVLFSVNYSNDYNLYDEAFFGNYVRDSNDPSQNELILATSQTGVQAENNVLIGLLGGLAYKTDKSKYSLTGIHLQSGNSRAGEFDLLSSNEAAGQSGFVGLTDNLEYSERRISSLLLKGEHELGGDWSAVWRMSGTASRADDPDIRRTPFTINSGGNFVFSSGEAGLPFRVWRFLDDWILNPSLDITKDYELFNRDAKLKLGGNAVFKDRDYEILAYNVQFTGTQANQNFATPNPDLVLVPENIFPNGGQARAFFSESNGFPNPNEYQADSRLYAAYISNEFQLFDNFKTILGVRMENFTANHTGRSADGANVLNDAEVISSTDFFPSVNMVYSATSKMNIRAVYSRTIARPSFKELSFASIVDPFKDRIFLGGLNPIDNWDGNLTETLIDNFDLRWEYFLGRGELISVSGFYKSFDRPIELVRLASAQTTVQYQPRNVGDGTVFGMELEVNKNLEFISGFLRDFMLTVNYTLLDSEIDMNQQELDTRDDGLRTGETLETTRQMVGQSPFVVNAGLIYNNKAYGIETGVFYNVRGRTLSVVGTGLVPDVYDRPFNDMSWTFRKLFGKEQNLSLDFRVTNILNDQRESIFQSFQAQDQLYERINPNRTFSLGLSYSF